MQNQRMLSRRRLLGHGCRGALLAGIGSGLGTTAWSGGGPVGAWLEQDQGIDFGRHRDRVEFLLSASPSGMLDHVVEGLRKGETREDWAAASALANAVTFGGEDYDGYHVAMALIPSLRMSSRLGGTDAKLALLKVMHRNARRMQKVGAPGKRALRGVPKAAAGSEDTAMRLVAAVRAVDLEAAEAEFRSTSSRGSSAQAEALLPLVCDDAEVHRVVLLERAYDMVGLCGEEQAQVLLRQLVRFSIDVEPRISKRSRTRELRKCVPAVVEEFGLERAPKAQKAASAADIEAWANQLVRNSRAEGARMVGEALAQGVSEDAMGEAISLAGAELILRDPGRSRSEASKEKPEGSVHGASTGVHASDSALAWRGLATLGDWPTRAATWVTAAFHVAGQGDGHREACPGLAEARESLSKEPVAHDRTRLAEAIRAGEQARAVALAERMSAEPGSEGDLFGTLASASLEADGALHAEKIDETTTSAYRRARPEHRARFPMALARVCASEAGFEAPGLADARERLGT